MAQPSLEQFKKRGMVMKVEATEGTDSTPVGATDGIMLLNGQSGTEFDKIERAIDRPFFTNNPFGVANRRAYIEGDYELIPPATPGAASTNSAPGDILLLSGGMTKVLSLPSKTTTYNPISSGIVSASAYWWHVDAHKKVLGSRTAISAMRMAIGAMAQCRVRVQGSYESVTEDALPSITHPPSIPVVATDINSTAHVTVNGGSDLLVWAKELSLDFGTDLRTKQYTSHKSTSINDRLATWTLRIARTDLSDFNPWTVRDAASVFEAKFRTLVTVPTGLYTELGIRGQLETINEVDIDGDYGWELSGPCIASNTGGDEFYLTFGDSTP